MTTAHVESLAGAPRLQIRRRRNAGAPVLYVHGATFPAGLSVAYAFADGRSWEAALFEASFDVWALDFAGYGGSERPAEHGAATGCAADAALQIARAAGHIREMRSGARVHIIAHSWGTIPAAMFAAAHPDAVDRIVLFGPILRRAGERELADDADAPWRFITVEQQRARFEQDTPAGEASVLAEPDLQQWGKAWLSTDPTSHTRTPPSVIVPAGPQADIAAMWSGRWLYDPAAVAAPVMVVRGAWDSLCTDADVAGFLAASGARERRDVKLPRGGHLMHLETGSDALWAATNTFLLGGER